MAPDPSSRPSRTAWPLPRTGSTVPEHDHGFGEMPKLIWGLVVVVLGLSVVVGILIVRDIQQQAYLEGRGEYRDREAARMEEANRQRFCRLLDQFPQGGLLDRARDEFACEPGNGYDPALIDPDRLQEHMDMFDHDAEQPASETPQWPATNSPPDKDTP